MKAVVLAIVLAITGSIGFVGVASAQAGPPSDAQGYWQWIIDHGRLERPPVECCPVGPSKAPCTTAPAPAAPACPPDFRSSLHR